ncbi:MAG: hypothetical protein ACRDLK_01225, partial [Gaiellaceae bacterium]
MFAGTPLEGELPQQLTLGDVYRTPSALAYLEAHYTLADLSLGGTLLRGVRTLSYLLGGKTLDHIDLPGGQTWCEALAAAGGSCANVNPATTTVIGLDIMSQLGSLDLGSLTVGDLVGGLDGTIVGDAYLARIAFQQTSIADIPVSTLPDPSAVVSCTTCATLRDAAAQGAVRDGVPLTALGAALDGVRLSELVVALVPRSSLPWEQEPFLGWQGFAPGVPQLSYHLGFDLSCPATGVSAQVTLPFGFLYVPGSSRLTVGTAAPFTLPDPALDPTTGATWSGLPVGSCGSGTTHIQLDFQGEPGFRLGPSPSRARVTAGGVSASVSGAPVDVQGAWSAAQVETTAPTIAPDTIVLAHIDHSGGTNYFRLPEQGRGRLVTIYLKPPAGHDYDLYVVRPAPDSLLASPIPNAPIPNAPIPNAPIPNAPIPNASTSTTTTTDNPSPESLDDGPLPNGAVAVNSVVRGDGVEVVSFRQAGDAGYDEIAVAGYNGDSSTDPFELRV